ncbi:MAG: 30S ribosomal protein S17 [Candidatus Omnitrophota bacterium]
MSNRENLRRTLTGTVVSDKMSKTRVVQVLNISKHEKYHKTVRSAKKFKAHDEENKTRVGDRVKIMETRRLSKDKRWVIMDVVNQS